MRRATLINLARLLGCGMLAVEGMAALKITLSVIEKVLNHKSGTFRGVVGIYQRHEFAAEKREALQRWANHVEGLVTGKAEDDKVHRLPARR